MPQTMGLSAYDNLTGLVFITHLLAITVTSFKSSVCCRLIACRGQRKYIQMNQTFSFYINVDVTSRPCLYLVLRSVLSDLITSGQSRRIAVYTWH